MDPVTAHTTIAAPREEVFDLVSDLAVRIAWADHFLEDYRLTTPKSRGVGAAARFRLAAPWKQWAEIDIVEAERPRRLVEEGGIGRLGRSRLRFEYEFSRGSGGVTHVELTSSTVPANVIQRTRERLGRRRWLKRQTRVALERLRRIVEERPDAPLARVQIAGFEPNKSPRFNMP